MDDQYRAGPGAPGEGATGQVTASQEADTAYGRQLLQATRPFASESVARSWWEFGSILLLVVGTLTVAGLASGWPLRAACSVLGALFMVRLFITYHDHMHGALLRDSRLAAVLFRVYGWFALVPAHSWQKSHNYHHGHVGRISWDAIGAFPLVTTHMWHEATPAQRAQYRATRHPLVLLFAYVTVFAFSITLLPLLRDPRRHWDSALALLAHGGLIATLWVFGGFWTAWFAVLLPMAISSILGGYLFFAQHSFKRMIVLSPEAWTFYRAALVSSSYMRLGRVLQWFTGNIGYHHIHHLNVRIPFYRLPEAMAAIPELQSPITTSLSPSEILGCFRACLWDEASQRMMSYHEAA